MITLIDIRNAFTKEISSVFKCDVWPEQQSQGFEGKCFYVNVLPSATSHRTRDTLNKSPMVVIKYFSNSKDDLYNTADILADMFALNIKVKDRYLSISNADGSTYNDGVGEVLEFFVYLDYLDSPRVKQEEELDPMEDIEIN